MRSLIIIPAYNEERNIGKVLDDIRAHVPDADVVVINDGSTDATAAIASGYGITVLSIPYNVGIGAAMQTGYRYALKKGYDIAIQFDGDGQHRADQVTAIRASLLAAEGDMVIGSRFLGEKGYRPGLARHSGIKILSWTISLLIGHLITDPTSGFRAVNRKVIGFFSTHYPDDYPEPEAVVLLKRAGFKIAEVPVLMRERQTGKSSITPLKAFLYMTKVLLAILVEMLKKVPANTRVS
jgi:glycosyltransferase involved in cell wall biosynthesis